MKYFDVAQQAEQRTVNAKVLGSIPSIGAILRGYAHGLRRRSSKPCSKGSIPFIRSTNAVIAQLAEQLPCKHQVRSSILRGGTILALSTTTRIAA
jgi:hypothetical protein